MKTYILTFQEFSSLIIPNLSQNHPFAFLSIHWKIKAIINGFYINKILTFVRRRCRLVYSPSARFRYKTSSFMNSICCIVALLNFCICDLNVFGFLQLRLYVRICQRIDVHLQLHHQGKGAYWRHMRVGLALLSINARPPMLLLKSFRGILRRTNALMLAV